MRVEIEQRIQEACDRGMRAIVLRAGDFFGGGSGSWFDLVIAKEIARGRLTYPGPLDVEHAWAYLPDYATTLVRLAERRAELRGRSSFRLSRPYGDRAGVDRNDRGGHQGSKFNVRPMSWWLIKTVGQLTAMGREIGELEYLWRVPHRHFRRQAQGCDRRHSAHAAASGGRGLAPRDRV